MYEYELRESITEIVKSYLYMAREEGIYPVEANIERNVKLLSEMISNIIIKEKENPRDIISIGETSIRGHSTGIIDKDSQIIENVTDPIDYRQKYYDVVNALKVIQSHIK